jgi:hypothetical protein
LEVQEQIGTTAGEIYRYLLNNGEDSTVNLKKALPVKDTTILNMGIGWLAREGKIHLRQKGKTTLVSLVNGS